MHRVIHLATGTAVLFAAASLACAGRASSTSILRVRLQPQVVRLGKESPIAASGIHAAAVEVRLSGATDFAGRPLPRTRPRLARATWHGGLPAPALRGIYPVELRAAGGAGTKAPHAAWPSTATTLVRVTVTDSRFVFSRHTAPVGTVIFSVTNKGKRPHDFKIAGKKTPLLAPARFATLRVTFTRGGRYPYRSTVSGQASAGLKGVFTVAARRPPPPPPPPPTTTSGTVGTANTTVKVGMFDQATSSTGTPTFVLSQLTAASGTITFEITSSCNGCNFNLEGIKVGTTLNPGQSETWTVALPPGIYRYHCDIFPKVMKGTFTVTP
jgi:plastocyanin